MRNVIVFGITALLSAGVVMPVYAASPAAGEHAPRIKLKEGSSSNWSGYAVETNLINPQSNAVSDVKGSWAVPSVICSSSSANTYSAAWVGIDGDSDNTVEQTGTEQDCANGSPRYYAWYEMYPRASHSIGIAVHPGDVIQAEVRYIGGNNFQLTLVDTTTSKTFSIIQKLNAHRQSAEWIMEAPSSGSTLPLADFGIIPFTSASATLNNITGSIGNGAWQHDEITMTNNSGAPKATPSALSPDGSSFNVTWNSSN